MKIQISLSNVSIPPILYKWVKSSEWQKYIDANVLPAKRWKRYIEQLDTVVTGNSFTDKKHASKWKLPEYDLLVALRTATLPNRIWPQNGNRSHLQTLGKTKANFDPSAYTFESTEVDEYFIEGPIRNISSHLVVK